MPARKQQPPDDLFEAALAERLARQAPLAARMRPRTLDDLVGQEHLLGPGQPLRAMISDDKLSSIILWGPPGTGKTTLARLIASATEKEFVPLSAVSAGVKDVRDTVELARRRLAEESRGTILFLDEVHRFNKAQQDALLPSVEEGVLTLIGATTENPFFEVNAPLLSRSTLFRLQPLTQDDILLILRRAMAAESVTADDDALKHLSDQAEGDARAGLTALEVAIALARHRDGKDAAHVVLADAEAARGTRAIRYERDEHYDVISAFIKSIRGSDPDAGLYWLSRMLEAGEDARFIARRLVILASEDVGMADSMGLVVADAAARAVEFVGLPEASLNLAHAVVYLASAPKSNRSTIGLIRAGNDVRDRPAGPVPGHLKSAHPWQRNKLGDGVGYQYTHDDASGFIAQEYRPPEVAGRTYYLPSDFGDEAAVAERLRALWGDEKYDAAPRPKGKGKDA